MIVRAQILLSRRPSATWPPDDTRSVVKSDQLGEYGTSGASWAFHYDIHGDKDDDETGYRFGDHAFIAGEYVSIMEHDDVLRTFRVVSVQAASLLSIKRKGALIWPLMEY